MAVDGEVKIKTAIDNSKLDEGLKETENKIKKASDSFKTGFAKSAVAVAGVTAAIATAKKVVDELTDAYRTQIQAETQLESAAKNNPYLSSESVQRLKDYAGQLQSISTTGDEELLPYMGRLASMGRTESEIMEIMAVSLDVAASGTMSLESAMMNLAKTFGGYAGELGETNPKIKALTQEQLKNGEAVRVMKEQYAGIAEEVAKSTGSAQQLKNAMGDLKEELGAPFEKALTPVRNFFTELIGGWANAKKAKREYEEASALNEAGKGTAQTVKTQLDVEREKLEELTKAYNELEAKVSGKGGTQPTLPAYLTGNRGTPVTSSRDTARVQAEAELKTAKENLEAKKQLVANLEAEYKLKQEIEKADAERAAEMERQAKILAEKNERDAQALDYMAQNEKALQKQLDALRIQAEQTGTNVSEQEKFNAMLQSYISLVTDSNGLVSEGNQYAKQRLEQLKAQAELAKAELSSNIDNLDTDEERVEVNEKLKELLDAMAEISAGDISVVEAMENQLSELNNLYSQVIDMTELTEKQRLEIETEYGEKRKALEKSIAEAKKQYAVESVVEVASTVASLASQLEQVVSDATALTAQANEAETERQLGNLAEQYNEGIISYEEYIQKKERIDKQAAQKQYKLDMFNWTASLLTATANIAQGVSQAIAQGGVLGIITGALVAAAGAIQIATITANKPRPPSFATGGIVPGTSYSGDRVQANVNSGEMILTAQQQRNLWELANTGRGGGNIVNMPITIENTISDRARASAQVTESGIRVIIDDMVNSSMKEGRYNDSISIAQARGEGVRYL